MKSWKLAILFDIKEFVVPTEIINILINMDILFLSGEDGLTPMKPVHHPETWKAIWWARRFYALQCIRRDEGIAPTMTFTVTQSIDILLIFIMNNFYPAQIRMKIIKRIGDSNINIFI